MNIFEALRVSHDLQRRLCRSLVRIQPQNREPVFLRLKVELAAHAAAEERFLYVPLLMTDAGLSASRHALGEHHEIEELCDELSVAGKEVGRWLEGARCLSDKVHHHLREEERKFFQVAGKLLTERNKLALGGRYLHNLVHMRRHYAKPYASLHVGRDGEVAAAGRVHP